MHLLLQRVSEMPAAHACNTSLHRMLRAVPLLQNKNGLQAPAAVSCCKCAKELLVCGSPSCTCGGKQVPDACSRSVREPCDMCRWASWTEC